MRKMIAVISAAMLASCGGGGSGDEFAGTSQTGGTVTPANGSTGTQGTSANENQQASAALPADEFLRSEYQEGLGEIQISRLALERATAPQVKQFAQLMIDHHTQANTEIETLASQRGLSLSGTVPDYQSQYEQLQGLSGTEFDRAYMSHNVTTHDTEVSQLINMLIAAGRLNADESAVSGTENATTGTGATGSGTAGTGTTGAGAAGTGATGAGTTGTGTTSTGTNGTGAGNGSSAASTDTTTQTGATIDIALATYLVKMKAVLSQHLGMAKEINGEINPDAWLANAYQDGLAEIQLSTLALDRARSADVRSFAQMMIDEHAQANNDIAQVAQAKGVTLPSIVTADQRSAAAELKELDGAIFDKAYMNHNVIVHTLDVKQTRVQAAGAGDTGVQAVAARTLPRLETHLTEATRIYQALPNDLLLGAWADGLGEILLSSLAVQRATDPEVKQYAQTMINDHTQANTTVAKLADERDRFLPVEPSAETALAYMEIAPLTGTDFDRAYMEDNVAVHQKDVALFSDRVQNETDEALRTFAAQTLPVLNTHLQEAIALRDRLAAGAGTTGTGTTGAGAAGAGTTGTGTTGTGTTGTGTTGTGTTGTGTIGTGTTGTGTAGTGMAGTGMTATTF